MENDLKRYAKIIKTLRLELNKIEPESNAAWDVLKRLHGLHTLYFNTNEALKADNQPKPRHLKLAA